MSPSGAQLAAELAEIKAALQALPQMRADLQALAASMQAFREEYVREHAALASNAQLAHSRLDGLEKDLGRLSEGLAEAARLLPLVRALAFLLAGLSVPLLLAIGSWLWQLLTHGGSLV